MRRYVSASMGILLPLVLLAAPMAWAASRQEAGNTIKVIAVETFLADIAQNVAGDRVHIKALLPLGADPHAFQPTPADIKEVAESNVLIINGAGFEEYLEEMLKKLGGTRKIIDASAGLAFRTPGKEEPADSDEKEHHHNEAHHHHEGDPHFWLSVANVLRYVENIRNGLSTADPEGAKVYAANAESYSTALNHLDRWISDQVKQIPENKRLMVTDHDDLGYFADRYGLKIVGMVVPSLSTEASPSARQIADLVKTIRATGAGAIFLEAGESTQLANQIAKETSIKVAAGLYTHSTSQPGGPAPDYIEMMRYNTRTIVNALK